MPFSKFSMSPGNLTFNCVDFNKMSIENTFYGDPVEGLNSWSSLTIKVTSKTSVFVKEPI